jgi:hypothetical protein
MRFDVLISATAPKLGKKNPLGLLLWLPDRNCSEHLILPDGDVQGPGSN